MSVFRKEYDIKAKRLWRCHVCNDLHYGAAPPLICPTCGARRAFVLVDREETLKILGERGGSIPPDNPISGSPVWSLGHRNPQGLAWTESGALYASEHGPSGEGGASAHDEVNLISPGSNYGWPMHAGYSDDAGYVSPVYSTESETWAPSGCTFVSSDRYPGWRGSLLVACLRGRGVRLIKLNAAGDGVDSVSTILTNYGRVREVVEGLDGYIYFTTSNRDGRGIPASDDDRILKIVSLDGVG